ncbi:MAG: hypothetical protein ACE5DK_02350 [Paracoccaceae bacterium]
MALKVSRLRIAEEVCINSNALNLLRAGLEGDETHDVVEHAVIEVARFMGAIEQAVDTENLDHLTDAAEGLSLIGERMGFLVLARVAQDAIACAERRDLNALHAVAERLIRVGDASLAAAIDGAMLPV